jgi:Fe-S-cluster containining protein
VFPVVSGVNPYQHLLSEARQNKDRNRQLLKRLKKKKPAQLDEVVHQLHDEAFEQIDCLKCANCCKTTSPRILPKDIDRLAKHLRIRPSELVDQHLTIDEDGDYVFTGAPCPFLGDDHYCSVYEHRPQACREYPHTDRRKFHQALDITYHNTMICPAVAHIVAAMEKAFA